MNIFATNSCPIISAQDHCNVHVVKMATEAPQILSTAHFILSGKQIGMKPTHHNHPACIWARESKANYEWLYKHYVALCEEYTHRTGKLHASSSHILALKTAPNFSTSSAFGDDVSPHPQCMPEEFKKTLDPHKNYQCYLKHKFYEWQTRTDKRRMKVEWTNRQQPEWMSCAKCSMTQLHQPCEAYPNYWYLKGEM